MATQPTIHHYIQQAIACRKKGNHDAALQLCRRALELNPDNPDTYHCMGVLEIDLGKIEQGIRWIQKAVAFDGSRPEFLVSLGDAFAANKLFPKAIACYRNAIRIDSAYIPAYLNLHETFNRNKMAVEAEDVLEMALSANPDCIEVYLQLGQSLMKNGRHRKAQGIFRQACKIDPQCSDCHFYLGLAYQTDCKHDKALKHYQKALLIRPDLIEAHVNSGLVHTIENNFKAARQSYERALTIDPGSPHTANNLGNLCMRQGQIEEALHWYEKAVSSDPKFTQARLNFANCLRMNGRNKDARDCYEELIQEFPDDAKPMNGLGIVYQGLKDHKKAITYFKKAIALNPNSIGAYHNLATIYHDINDYAGTMQCLDNILKIRPDFATKIKKCMMIPNIYQSSDEIRKVRRRMESGMDKLLISGETLEDPFKQVGIANFLLALHGYNERRIREKIADFYLNVCPDLRWVSPQLKKKKTKKITIGMVSRFFHNCTIGNLFHGIITNIAKTKFELILFSLSWKDDEISRSMASFADRVVRLPEDFRAAREIISEYAPDILFYPEIGMDPLTYFLAFSRLAPVQCKKGFPVTMGIPAIDYFISSKLTEPSDAEANYTERLVQLDSLGYFFARPSIPKHRFSANDLGIPDGKTMYACLQSLFKLHPDFDTFIAKIFNRDPNAVLLLMEGQQREWNEIVVNRIEKVVPDASNKIFFIPRQPREKFVALFLLPDAVIDSIYFSGGHTSLECFALGVPVVTWPSSQMAGRLTYGYYQRMGVTDCIAKDADEFADIAFRLAHDAPWRENVSRKIKDRSAVLFENLSDVRELENFLEQAVAAGYSPD